MYKFPNDFQKSISLLKISKMKLAVLVTILVTGSNAQSSKAVCYTSKNEKKEYVPFKFDFFHFKRLTSLKIPG